MDLSAWVAEITALAMAQPLLTAVVAIALLALLVWQLKLFLKLLCVVAGAILLLYILDSLTDLTTTGVKQKGGMVHEESQ